MQALLLFICMATALAVPFDVSFHTLLDNSLPFIHSTMAAVEIVFLMDIYNNFRTGYYSATRGSFVFNRRLIASRYARSHLMTDVLAALPVTLARLAPHWALGSQGSGFSLHPSETSDMVNVYSLLQCAPLHQAHYCHPITPQHSVAPESLLSTCSLEMGRGRSCMHSGGLLT